ncbi:uncharacterized protein METZ01_LOCUS141695, partial [marine metagenome]
MKHTLLTLTIASLLATTAFADPIHDAAKTGDLAGVQAELDKGVDVNEVDRSFYNLTPLHWTISKGVAELLISEGADVNAITLEGSTPLHFAAWNGYKEVAEILIDNGADLNVINNELAGTPFITALDWAIQQGNTETADLLRKHGGMTVEELKAGMTPLHAAAGKGLKEIVELLIAEGADVNAKDDKGRTPLDLATRLTSWSHVRRKRTETAALLRKHGGKTTRPNISIHQAAGAQGRKGNIEAVKWHLAAGMDVDARDRQDKTPLQHAAYWGHKEIVELLIAKKTEIGKTKKELEAAESIHDASRYGNIEAVKQHLAAGTDVDARDAEDKTPLQH